MKSMFFVEIDRFATGGLHSIEGLIITFEGKESDYSEDRYVEIPYGTKGSSHYYSILVSSGSLFNNLEDFKQYHNSKSIGKFEVKRLTS